MWRNTLRLTTLLLTVFLLTFTPAGCDSPTVVMREREAATVRTAITARVLVKNGAGVWVKATRKLIVGETIVGLARPKFDAAISSGTVTVKGAPILLSDHDICIFREPLKVDVWLRGVDGSKLAGVRDVQPGELALGDVKLPGGNALPVIPKTAPAPTSELPPAETIARPGLNVVH